MKNISFELKILYFKHLKEVVDDLKHEAFSDVSVHELVVDRILRELEKLMWCDNFKYEFWSTL